MSPVDMANLSRMVPGNLSPSVGWLGVVLRIVALAVLQPYHDLEAGDNKFLKFKWRDRESNLGPLLCKPKV